MKRTLGVLIAAVLGLLLASTANASYGIYVGKELTVDGSVLIGGSGDEVSGHWLEIVPRQEHEEGATIEVGVTEEAAIPGELIEIPQAPVTYKFIGTFYSDFEGFPPPLVNGGLNEHGVAGRDIWSPSRAELVEMTPTPQRGPQYSDLSRIAMERATSAREAVEIIGSLIDEYGYSTYGGNSHMFADEQEGWVLIQMAGGQGLWVAERLGSDEVRLSYPGYILEIPDNYQEHPDYMGSDNLIEFAVEQGWYDPEEGVPFNVNEVYGNQTGRDTVMFRTEDTTIADFEERVRELTPVSLEAMMALVRDPILSGDSTGYGQVAQLHEEVSHPELRVLWAAATGSVTTPFIPYHIGVESVPSEYGRHRYLGRDEASQFVTQDWQVQEATEYAFRTFKRLMYFTCDRPEEFLPEVTRALTAFEVGMIDELASVQETALALFEADRPELAREQLTRYSDNQSMEGLWLGNALLASIEARTKVQYGIRAPETDEVSRLDYDMVNCIAD